MRKTNKEEFEFSIKPKESNFLKSWNELRKQKSFNKELIRVRKEIDALKKEGGLP